MDLSVLPLHKHPQYTMQCCELINSEWKRSITARMRSLESSCDTLPTCLILLKGDKVIGHCKLSIIPSISNACFMESVVINKELRGQGYGKYLMKQAEQYCKENLNLKTIYLSTNDQELFYSKLGYNRCQPISIYGSPLTKPATCNTHYTMKTSKTKDVPVTKTTIPIPPSLPGIVTNSLQCQKVYMNKVV